MAFLLCDHRDTNFNRLNTHGKELNLKWLKVFLVQFSHNKAYFPALLEPSTCLLQLTIELSKYSQLRLAELYGFHRKLLQKSSCKFIKQGTLLFIKCTTRRSVVQTKDEILEKLGAGVSPASGEALPARLQQRVGLIL